MHQYDFQNVWIKDKHIGIGPCKYVTKLLKQSFISCNLFLRIEAPRIMLSVIATKISTLIVGEMLSMLPSSKESRVGIRFLNQST